MMQLRLTAFGLKGVVFYASMVLAFFAAPYSNLFFLALAFLTLQWFVCAAATVRNTARVEALPERLEALPAGRTGALRYEIEAPGRTRYGLTVELELEGADPVRGRAHVLDRRGVCEVELPALERGVYPVRASTLRSSFPFGLLRAARAVAAPAELVVYPAPLSGAQALRGRRSGAADGARSTAAGNLQPAGLSEFREGGDPRAIHWRASARRGELVVCDWDGAEVESREVRLDRRCSVLDLEQALVVISTLLAEAESEGRALGLRTQGLEARFGPGGRPLAEALRFLATARTLPRDAEPPPAGARDSLCLPHEVTRE